MMRTMLALVAGSLAGAAAVHYFEVVRAPEIASAGGGASRPAAARPGGRGASSSADLGAQAPSVEDRIGLLRAAAAADIPALERLIERAAADDSDASRYALAVYLARYAERDPQAALRFGLAKRLDERSLESLFRRLAVADARAALIELRGLTDRDEAEAMGLAVLRVLGYDDEDVSRVAAALPGVDPERFRLDALLARGASEPADALRQALAWTLPASRRIAVARLADAWAGRDPRAALAAVDLIRDPVERSAFERVVAQRWALLDPVASFEYAVGSGAPAAETNLLLGAALPGVAVADPERMLAMTDRLPPSFRAMAKRAALEALAGTDPEAALSRLDGLPPAERRQMLVGVAAGYAAKDPDAALAWARELRPPVPGLLQTVVQGAAGVDFDHALELAMTLPEPERISALQMISLRGPVDGDESAGVAEKLLALPEGTSRRVVLQMFMSRWSSRDSAAAMRWLLANAGSVPAQSFAQVAANLARQDPRAAMGYADQIPEAAREGWIAAVAQGYAQTDPEGAIEWLDQLRGQPGHDAGVLAAAQALAPYDPQTAADLVMQADGNDARAQSTVAMVVSQWAQQDAEAAAQWALGLSRASQRQAALATSLGPWAAREPQAAKAWTLGLPPGPDRDAALGSVVAVGAGEPDPQLLNAFASDPARQRALNRAIVTFARRDPAAARAFVERYFTDPAERGRAERLLQALFGGPANGSGVVFEANGRVAAPVGPAAASRLSRSP